MSVKKHDCFNVSCCVNATPSTPDGMFTGRAWCRGDLQTGAYWDNIRVTRSCQGWEWQDSSSSSDSDDDDDTSWDIETQSSKIDDSIDAEDGLALHKAPNSALLELDEVSLVNLVPVHVKTSSGIRA